MSKGKVDVSFIKHVATSDDFQREVIDHGKDNLLVGAPRRLRPHVAPHASEPIRATSPVQTPTRRASRRARVSQWSTSTQVSGARATCSISTL